VPDDDPLTFDRTLGAIDVVLERCAADGDRIGYFAAMYVAVTTTIRERADSGRFEDAARMERFVSHFARRYLDAVEAWRVGAPCTDSWRAAFQASQQWRPIILQHLLLGMNAHINLDLGVTVAELGAGGSIEAMRADFDAMNDVLGQLVNCCQGALDEVSPWLGLADRIGGPGDESVIRFSLIAARRQAWSVATRLSTLTGADFDRAVRDVDRSTALVAGAIAHPGLPASAVLLAVRARERAQPAQVMRLLGAARPDPVAPSPP
jgi:Family of unknown function (DUF5995)